MKKYLNITNDSVQKENDPSQTIIEVVRWLILIIAIILGAAGSVASMNSNEHAPVYWVLFSVCFSIFLLYTLFLRVNLIIEKTMSKKITTYMEDFYDLISKREHENHKKIWLDVLKQNLFDTTDTLHKNKDELWKEYLREYDDLEKKDGEIIKTRDNKQLETLLFPRTSFYAVTVFIIYNDGMIFEIDDSKDHQQGKNIKAIGRRMPINVLPHVCIQDLILKTTKYESNQYEFMDLTIEQKLLQNLRYKDKICEKNKHNNIDSRLEEHIANRIPTTEEFEINDHTKFVPTPICTLLETNLQYNGIPYHIDFVYLVKIKQNEHHKNSFNTLNKLTTQPFSFDGVYRALVNNEFAYEGQKKILERILKHEHSDFNEKLNNAKLNKNKQ